MIIEKTQQIEDSNFKTLIGSERPSLIDFWAPRCSSCKEISSVVAELSKEYAGRVNNAGTNIDDNPITPEQLAIRVIPTIILFKNGQAIVQVTGGAEKNNWPLS